MKKRAIFSLLMISLIFLAVYPGITKANPDATGVSVLNVDPKISYIHFSSSDGIHMVEVNVSDYNSWKDIYRISMTFTAEDGPITVISYTQYSNRSDMNSRVDWFNESFGHYLLKEKTGIVYRVFNGSTVDEKCNLNITFGFRPVEALKVVVVVEDLSGAVAISRVDYPPLFGFPMEEEPFSTDLIAVVLSVFGTAGGIKLKYGSFKKPIKNLRNGVKEVRKR